MEKDRNLATGLIRKYGNSIDTEKNQQKKTINAWDKVEKTTRKNPSRNNIVRSKQQMKMSRPKKQVCKSTKISKQKSENKK